MPKLREQFPGLTPTVLANFKVVHSEKFKRSVVLVPGQSPDPKSSFNLLRKGE